MVASNALNALIILGGYSGPESHRKEAIEVLRIDSGDWNPDQPQSVSTSSGRDVSTQTEDGVRISNILEDFLQAKCKPLVRYSPCKPLDAPVDLNHWTVGNQIGDIGCQGNIAGGGSGGIYQVNQIHEAISNLGNRCMTQDLKLLNFFVCLTLIIQAFARKIIGISSNSADHKIIVANEIRLFEKFKACRLWQNVVFALQHGWIDNDHFYLDMELCVFNLNDFIRGCPQDIFTSPNYWNFPKEHDPLACFSLWGIIQQITKGLEFIHSKDEIHRDLKPHNGWGLLLHDN